MKLIGISAYYHDSAAALIVDGDIVAAVQEERFTRKKGDESFPGKSIQWILNSQGLSLEQIDGIVYYEKPWWTFERILETHLENAPKSFPAFLHALPVWLKQKLNTRSLLKKGFKKYFNYSLPTEKIFFSAHHLSHAASAYYPSPFSSAVVLCVDGVGEWATASIWKAEGHQLKALWELHFPHSLGLFYSAMTVFCGFKVNSGEYKLMGLAPFGKPRFLELIKKELVHIQDDGSIELNMKYFEYARGLKMFNEKLGELFGTTPRSFEGPMQDIYKDLAASTQALTNEIMLMWAQKAQALTGEKNLCLSGGVALNCVANGLIVNQKIFEQVWIQPAAGDAGSSAGAALAYYHLGLNKERTLRNPDGMKGAFLGPQYSETGLETALHEQKIMFSRFAFMDLSKKVAELLDQGKIVAWYQDSLEFGPRALGHRSILGDPRRENMQRDMNIKIKFREGFRPFAPIVLAEDLHTVFDLEEENPYMLLVGHTKPQWKLPAITHVDGSARIQTVDSSRHPQLHQLLQDFKAHTGCPVLINTSFNIRGEPLINTPAEAVRCFINTDIDVLVLGNFIAEKSQQTQIHKDQEWRKNFELD